MLESIMLAKPAWFTSRIRRIFSGIPLFFYLVTPPLQGSPVVNMNFESIKSRAEANDPYYQAALALIYRNGEKGQSISIDQFRNWAEKSSAQIHPLGFFAMGFLGKSENDHEKTKRFYRRAFGPGEGKLIKMAAEGDALASYALGQIILSNALDPDFKQDIGLAVRHFQIAAGLGHEPSRAQYAMFRLKGEGGVLKNEPEGFAILLKASEHDLPNAHYYLGRAYFEGLGVEKNDGQALVHMVEAAELNHGMAQLVTANFYANGVATAINWELAAKYAGNAAAMGIPKAAERFKEYELKRLENASNPGQSEISVNVPSPENTLTPEERVGRVVTPPDPSIVQSPISTTPAVVPNVGKEALTNARYALRLRHDVKVAVAQYRLAAESGEIDAQRELAELYYEGSFVDRDYHSAIKWFRQAADAGDAASQRYLGAMYFIGKGLAKDKKEAAKWLRLAAAQGDALAQDQLKMVERLIPR